MLKTVTLTADASRARALLSAGRYRLLAYPIQVAHALCAYTPHTLTGLHDVAVPNWWHGSTDAQQYIVILPHRATIEAQGAVEDALGVHGELLTYLPHNSFLFVADPPTAAALPQRVPGSVVHPYVAAFKFVAEVCVCVLFIPCGVVVGTFFLGVAKQWRLCLHVCIRMHTGYTAAT